jgi:hypothetical protein
MDMIKLKELFHKYDLDNEFDLIDELGKEFRKVAETKSKIEEFATNMLQPHMDNYKLYSDDEVAAAIPFCENSIAKQILKILGD